MTVNTCRICLEGESPNLGELFRPCLCKGSGGLVHVTCLETWRKQSCNHEAKYKCTTCLFEYRISRAWYAQILLHWVTITILTALSVIGLTYIASLCWNLMALFQNGAKFTYRILTVSLAAIWMGTVIIGILTLVVFILQLIFRESVEIDIDIGGLLDIVIEFLADTKIWGWDLFEYLTMFFAGLGYAGYIMFAYWMYFLIRRKVESCLNTVKEKVLHVSE